MKMLAGELEEAERDIDKAIEMNPRKEVLFIRKGDIVARRRGLEEAIDYYRKAVDINPLNHEAHERLENVYSILYKGKGVQDEIFR